MEEEIIDLANLDPQVIEEIFSRVPLKSRARMKRVSSRWHRFLTRLRTTHAPTTSASLIAFLMRHHGSETTLIKLQDQTLARAWQNPNATLHQSHKFPYLVESCNGLLLYATSDQDSWTYHISTPPGENQCTIPLPVAHKVSRQASVGISFDGCHLSRFKVICFFCDEVDFKAGTIKCQIFSSQTWHWRDKVAIIVNPNLLLEDGFIRGECYCPKVYFRKKLYLIWSFCLLVYDDEKEFFELIRLPKNKSRRDKRNSYMSQCIWESEERIQFCDPSYNGYDIWTFIDRGDGDNNDDFAWHFERCVTLKDLIYRRVDVFHSANVAEREKVGWARNSIRPIAFNEDLQVLYLHVLPRTIYSYSFETREVAKVWSIDEAGDDDIWMFHIYPFLLNSVNLVALKEFIRSSSQ
ncbi:hypothetical protein RJ639_045955 [Escallonia herrerae]|uniref:F-box domain-containing protein n=1 Tax=Escallonia herrerae TaxID=1293975 RepID=A0AA89B515_9ASTE|nr:hypothetical protein RJ639_045955 [Escallonia herrerae]